MFLGLDLGTTNVKALRVDARGRVAARGDAPVRLRHPVPGAVEQDIDEIWQAAVTAIRQACQDDPSSVRSIGISSQGGAMQLLDAGGRPLGAVISWLDGRGRAYNAGLTEEKGPQWFTERIGRPGSAGAIGQILRLRESAPELLRPANRLGFVGDVIVARLCGRGAHDGTSLSIAGLYNPSLRRADPDVLHLVGLEEDRLPPLHKARETAGELRADAARTLGLSPGLPVAPACHDQYAAALGARVTHAGDVMFGAGTAWVLLALSDRLAPPVLKTAFVCEHLVDGLYGQLLSMVNGGSVFGWAVDLLGLTGATRDDLDALMESAPAGADGLRFRPLLVEGGGAGLPRGTRGQLTELRLHHGRAHVLRAVIEGLALEFGRYLEMLRAGGVRPERIVMCGRAAGGRVTPQIIADTTGLAVACASESEMSALGAAMLARALVEPETPLDDISGEMSAPVRQVNPDANAPSYAQRLADYRRTLEEKTI